nr:MAG TPA: hypothetical protein [Caudoviricetes sp.]
MLILYKKFYKYPQLYLLTQLTSMPFYNRTLLC